jgi:hypothetical protein
LGLSLDEFLAVGEAMDWFVETGTEGDTLVATVRGELGKADYLALREKVRSSLEETGTRHVLLDIRGAILQVSTMGVFAMAASNPDVIPRGRKYAVVYSLRTLPADNAVFGENVARNRGALLSAFTDIEEAKRWLTND